MVLGTGSHKGIHENAPLEYEGKHQNEHFPQTASAMRRLVSARGVREGRQW
jgi:hypothetical protein